MVSDRRDKNLKIMLMLQPAEVREIALFHLEAKLNVRVADTLSENDAVGYLSTHPHVDLILIDADQKWESFIHSLRESKAKATFVLLTTKGKRPRCDVTGFNVLDSIPKDKILERIPVVLQQYLEQNPEKETAIQEPDQKESNYCRLHTALLLRASPLESDIYIRLSSKKYLKLFAKGDTFNRLDLEKYLTKKKVSYLYVLKTATDEFISKFENVLTELLSGPVSDPQDVMQTAQDSVDTIQELSRKLGYTPKVQTLIKATSSLLVKISKKSKTLESVMGHLHKNKDEYISTHSLALAQISCSLAKLMEWHSDSTFQKLTIAAILHDITLTNQKLASVGSLEELEARKAEFTDEEIQSFPLHPYQAAQIIREFAEMLPDIDAIIIQHHENSSGTGFPRGLAPSKISALSTVFIVAHQIVDSVVAGNDPFSLYQFLMANPIENSSGNFKKVVDALKKVLG